MFNYEKRLQYPVNIKRTDAQMAKAIMSQFGGPDGETGASMRYLSQRFAMPYREVMGILTDVGTSVSLRRATRCHVIALVPGHPLSCHRFVAGPSRAILLPGYHASPEILPCIFLLRCYNKCITSSGRSMAYTVSEVSRFTYQIFPEEHAPAGVCRYGSSVEHWLPKPKRRVRLPLSAFFICAFLTCVSPAAQNGTRPRHLPGPCFVLWDYSCVIMSGTILLSFTSTSPLSVILSAGLTGSPSVPKDMIGL